MKITNKQLMRELRAWLDAQYELCNLMAGEIIIAEIEQRLTRFHERRSAGRVRLYKAP